jgi:hypothetical protein
VTRRAVLALTCALLLASCANIPELTSPQPIPNSEAQPRRVVQQPNKDDDPITVVRNFIKYSGDTATAQQYLTEEAKRVWRPDNQPTIIEDDFSTVPEPVDKEGDPNQTRVDVKGTKIGWLNSHKSFVSQVGNHNQTIKVAKQADGQWRIAELPGNGLVIQISVFTANYRPVKLYFYDMTKTVLVPDLRYLPGAPLASPSDIIALLLAGPAPGLEGAVRSALPPLAIQRNNVSQAKDGNVMVVNLGNLGNLTAEDKELIASQVVLSLQDVASAVRLQVEGLPLVPGRPEWKSADMLPPNDLTTPGAQLFGMMVVNSRVRSLKDNGPIVNIGASNGDYRVESAAQSVDGSQLAVVERTNTGLQLRVGVITESLRVVASAKSDMTRPTWQFGVSSNQMGNEVWTVADGAVVRMSRNKDNTWLTLPVDQGELTPYGKITELRLSRDGVRVAVVAGGKLYIGAVARTDNGSTVKISTPKLLPKVSSVVAVDWLNQSSVAVATNMPTGPVWRMSVDGTDADRYSLANLTLPLTSITAAPSRQVVVTDAVGMWAVSEIGQIWLPHGANQGPAARPFYPG